MVTTASDNIGKLVLRLTVAGLTLFHGVAKILHTGALDFIGGRLEALGLPAFISYGVYVGEVIAPALMIIGLYSRLAAALIVVNMLFAIGLVHAHEVFAIGGQGGWAIELQAFFLLGAVCVALFGSGRFAAAPD